MVNNSTKRTPLISNHWTYKGHGIWRCKSSS